MMIKQPIREVQGYLRLISADYPRIPELKPDGIFGPLTTEAVVEFQRQFELEATGVVDFETWTLIYEAYKKADQRRNPPHQRLPFPLRSGSYGIGDRGSEIVLIQTVLNELSTVYEMLESIRVLGLYEEPTAENICFAGKEDIPEWMDLMRQVIDGYPVMDEADYLEKLMIFIEEKRALVLRDQGILVGVMAFSNQTGSIEFLGVHPQYRRRGIQKLFVEALLKRYLPGREISMTTYREGDKADTGYREMFKRMGFAERELLMEYGYPTQRFVYLPDETEEM